MLQVETGIPDQRTSEEILREVLFGLITREHCPGSFPTQAVTLMGILLKSEVSIGDLAIKSGKSKRRIRHSVDRINEQYLLEHNIKILGERVYTLRKTDRTDQRTAKTILSDKISAIVNKERRYGSPAPEKLVKYLDVFFAIRIPISVLAEKLEMSKRSASRVVNYLNRIHLKDSGIIIEGDYFYRLEKVKK